MNNNQLIELFCPICQHTMNVLGERTETFSQFVAYCRRCGCEFTTNYFKVKEYTSLNHRSIKMKEQSNENRSN